MMCIGGATLCTARQLATIAAVKHQWVVIIPYRLMVKFDIKVEGYNSVNQALSTTIMAFAVKHAILVSIVVEGILYGAFSMLRILSMHHQTHYIYDFPISGFLLYIFQMCISILWEPFHKSKATRTVNIRLLSVLVVMFSFSTAVGTHPVI